MKNHPTFTFWRNQGKKVKDQRYWRSAPHLHSEGTQINTKRPALLRDHPTFTFRENLDQNLTSFIERPSHIYIQREPWSKLDQLYWGTIPHLHSERTLIKTWPALLRDHPTFTFRENLDQNLTSFIEGPSHIYVQREPWSKLDQLYWGTIPHLRSERTLIKTWPALLRDHPTFTFRENLDQNLTSFIEGPSHIYVQREPWSKLDQLYWGTIPHLRSERTLIKTWPALLRDHPTFTFRENLDQNLTSFIEGPSHIYVQREPWSKLDQLYWGTIPHLRSERTLIKTWPALLRDHPTFTFRENLDQNLTSFIEGPSHIYVQREPWSKLDQLYWGTIPHLRSERTLIKTWPALLRDHATLSWTDMPLLPPPPPPPPPPFDIFEPLQLHEALTKDQPHWQTTPLWHCHCWRTQKTSLIENERPPLWHIWRTQKTSLIENERPPLWHIWRTQKTSLIENERPPLWHIWRTQKTSLIENERPPLWHIWRTQKTSLIDRDATLVIFLKNLRQLSLTKMPPMTPFVTFSKNLKDSLSDRDATPVYIFEESKTSLTERDTTLLTFLKNPKDSLIDRDATPFDIFEEPKRVSLTEMPPIWHFWRVSKLVFYNQSTSAVISGQSFLKNLKDKSHWKKCHLPLTFLNLT